MNGIVAAAMGGAGRAGVEYLQKSTLLAEEGEIRSKLAQETAAIQRSRDERLAELREQSTIRGEDRKRAPYQRAAERGNASVDGAALLNEDAAGNVSRSEPSRSQQAALRARAYEEEGLPEVASRFRTEALTGEKLDLERESNARRDRQDQDQHSERMVILRRQEANQQRLINRELARLSLDKTQKNATLALIDGLVERGFGKTPVDAWKNYRIGLAKDPGVAVQTMATTLMKSGNMRYRGKEGNARAVEDAKGIVESISEQDSAQAGFDSVARPGSRTRRPLEEFLSAEE